MPRSALRFSVLVMALAGACRPAEEKGPEPTPRPPDAAASPDATRDARLPQPPADAGEDAPPPRDGRAPHATDFVFDDGKLETWRFTIGAAELKRLEEGALQEAEVPATLTIGDEEVGTVGLRHKGSFGTLQPCVQGGKLVCKKVSYKVDFDRFQPDKRFHGIKKVNLHAQFTDPTHLRERLAYQLFREMGIPAPRSVHAKVHVNGQYKGLFALTEQIDGRFLDLWFPKAEDGGNLYKEAWPLSPDPKHYTDRQKTNEGETPPTKVLAAAKALREAPPARRAEVLDAWFGLDYLMRYLAVDRATNNFDGVTAFYCLMGAAGGNCPNHNFYLYESPREDRLWLFPWDLDHTFHLFEWWETIGPWYKRPASCAKPVPINVHWLIPPACDPLFEGLGAAGRARYLAAVRQLLDGPFDVARMTAQLDAWAAQIGEAVREDANGPGYVAWQQAVATSKRELPLLRQRMEHILANGGDEPAPFGLALDQVGGFEGVTPFGFAQGVSVGASAGSRAERALNGDGPIAGAADLRITFDLRNAADAPSAAFDQRAYVRLNFAAERMNLQGLRQVKVKLKADVTRPVRIEIGSSRYKPSTGRPPRFGWETVATPQGGSITLDAKDLRIPAGLTSPGDNLSDILGSATVLYVVAQPTTRDPTTGLLPPGSHEEGWLQVDDVELVTR